jgi:hypothetical protein
MKAIYLAALFMLITFSSCSKEKREAECKKVRDADTEQITTNYSNGIITYSEMVSQLNNVSRNYDNCVK